MISVQCQCHPDDDKDRTDCICVKWKPQNIHHQLPHSWHYSTKHCLHKNDLYCICSCICILYFKIECNAEQHVMMHGSVNLWHFFIFLYFVFLYFVFSIFPYLKLQQYTRVFVDKTFLNFGSLSKKHHLPLIILMNVDLIFISILINGFQKSIM